MYTEGVMTIVLVCAEDVLFFYGALIDIELEKSVSDTGLFVSTTISIPNGLLIFNKRYNHIYVSNSEARNKSVQG